MSSPSVDRQPISHRIIRNVLFGGLRYLLIAPVPFVLTPIILKEIGTRGYGTWAVFTAVSGMTSLTDLGMVGTLSKFVAYHHARKDFVSLNRLLNTGLALFALLALLIVSLLWAGSNWIVATLFRGSALQATTLIPLFRYFLILIGANIMTMLFSSVTSGLQRLDLTNMVGSFNVLCGAMIGGALVLRGWGLPGLLYAAILSSLLTLLIYWVLFRRLLPQLILNPLRVDVSEAKNLFHFSFQLYLTQAAVAVHNQLEKVLLAFFVGVAPAGWYDIASDVALKIRGGISLLLSPILPAASELSALKDEHRLVELYYRSHKYLAFIGIPVVSFIGAVSTRFVSLWIGAGLALIGRPLSVLLAANLFNLMTGPGFLISVGRGDLKPGLQSALLGIILNIFLSTSLVYLFGFAGAVLGTATSLVAASIYFLYLFHRKTTLPVTRLLRESYLKPTICSLVLLGFLFVIHPSKGLTWLGLSLQGVVFASLYVIAISCWGFFDRYDWGKIESLIPGIRRARRIIPVA